MPPKGVIVLPGMKRVEGRYLIDPETGCWNWQRHKNEWGYGVLGVNGKSILAHRYVWQEKNGPIPSHMRVLHRCDNPACINQDHLFLGTLQDNALDMVAKGRNGHPKGEAHPCAKLSANDVRVILSRNSTTASLAREYNVTETTIRSIRRGRIWKCVPRQRIGPIREVEEK